jgi:hypothetical protein
MSRDLILPDETDLPNPLSLALAPACLFVLTHASVAAIFMLSVRQNLEGGHVSIVIALLHLWALVGCVMLGTTWADRYRPSARQLALAIGATVAYLLPLLGFAAGPSSLVVSGVLSAVALYLLFTTVVRHGLGVVFVLSCLGGALSGAWATVLANAEVYAHVLSYEFTILGWQAADPVFHPAVAALFRNYHVVTNGLDGTWPMFYHALSHISAAGFSLEAGELLPYVYPPFTQIFLVPALLLGTSAAAISLTSRQIGHAWLIPFLIVLFWIFCDWLGAYNSFLVSESYAFALGILSFGALYVAAGPRNGSLVVWVLTTAAVLLAVVAAKFTLVLVGTCLGGYGLWNLARDRAVWLKIPVVILTTFVFLAATGLLLYSIDVREIFEWFGFASHYPISFRVSVATIIVGAAAALAGRTFGLPMPRWYLIAFLGIALHIPDVFVHAQSAEYYWFHPADQIASIVMVAVAAVALSGLFARHRISGLVAAPSILLICGALLFTGQFPNSLSTLATTFRAFDEMAKVQQPPVNTELPADVRSHAAARAYLLEHGGHPLDPGRRAIPEALATIGRSAITGIPAEVGPFIATLPLATVSEAIAARAGPNDVAYLSPANRWYWDGSTDCVARNFRLQALTGVALLAGSAAPTEKCSYNPGYGIRQLPEEARNRDLDDQSLCELAVSRGFHRVFAIAGASRISTHSCR